MLFVLTGTEEFLISLKLQTWKDQFGTKYGSDAICSWTFGEDDVSWLAQELGSVGLFFEKKMLIIHGFPYPPKTRESALQMSDDVLGLITQYHADPAIMLVLVAPSPDKRTKAYKDIELLTKTQGKMEKFEGKNERERDIWLQEFPGGRVMTPTQRKQLIEWTGMDAGRMYNELMKRKTATDLGLYDQWTTLIYRDFHATVFVFLDALGGEKEQAMKLFGELRTQHEWTVDGTMMTMGGFLWGQKVMLLVALAHEQGLDKEQTKDATGLHPFVIAKTASTIKKRGLTSTRLVDTYEAILDADYQYKTGGLSPSLLWTTIQGIYEGLYTQ
ncbi:MAG: hypothetical protein NZL83_04030 [Candidatus Absconditabacterales bacterium]|nr:hypothetical protein [Candidatus Absconditabacterales bacterium]